MGVGRAPIKAEVEKVKCLLTNHEKNLDSRFIMDELNPIYSGMDERLRQRRPRQVRGIRTLGLKRVSAWSSYTVQGEEQRKAARTV